MHTLAMRFLLAFALLVILELSLAGTAAAKEARPNVIVIVIDDLGRNDLGCYGSKFFQTPRIDALAQQGARFTQAYANCPVCSPTRAAILTGRHPARLHLTDWLPGRGDKPDQMLARPQIRQQLPHEEITLAERFKEAGYVTGHIGKWHLGGEGFGPREQGFDVNIAGDHTGTPRSYFAPFKGMTGLEESTPGEYLTDRLAAEAEKFIAAHAKQPFFLYLPHYAVHTPLRAKEELIKKYTAQAVHGKQSHPVYAAMMESMDQSIGRVVDKLAELKLSERTIIVFTSDNGGLATQEGMPFAPTINAPLREGKGYLYEGGVRVPLIIAWPGKLQPQVNETMTASIDLLPTLLELCGVKTHQVDGVSIASALVDQKKLEHPPLFWHYPHYANQGSKPGGAVRDGDYKLIEFYETGRRELFNVVADPSESRNLAADKPEIVEQLAGKLASWKREMDAQEMTPNPDYVPNPQDKQGAVTLPARWAKVSGTQLRFEPLPHKNTLGYWTNPKDTAEWTFTITTPGKFFVEVLQGCGKGQGGSEVKVVCGDESLSFTVEDTGHFQNFVRREIGTIELKDAGRHTISLQPQSKAGVAVMDVRELRLVPAK